MTLIALFLGYSIKEKEEQDFPIKCVKMSSEKICPENLTKHTNTTGYLLSQEQGM